MTIGTLYERETCTPRSWPLAANTVGFSLSLCLSWTIGFQAWRQTSLRQAGGSIFQYLFFWNFLCHPKAHPETRDPMPQYKDQKLSPEVSPAERSPSWQQPGSWKLQHLSLSPLNLELLITMLSQVQSLILIIRMNIWLNA